MTIHFTEQINDDDDDDDDDDRVNYNRTGSLFVA